MLTDKQPHWNILTNTEKPAKFLVFLLEQLTSSDKVLNISQLVFKGRTVCPFVKRSELIWKWIMLQSHSQAFVIGSKIFNAPSGYADNRKAIKSYSLKMSYFKLFCGPGQLVWFGYCVRHWDAVLHQLLGHSALSTRCILWAPQEFNTLNIQMGFPVALWISELSNWVPECALVLKVQINQHSLNVYFPQINLVTSFLHIFVCVPGLQLESGHTEESVYSLLLRVCNPHAVLQQQRATVTSVIVNLCMLGCPNWSQDFRKPAG